MLRKGFEVADTWNLGDQDIRMEYYTPSFGTLHESFSSLQVEFRI